MFKKANSLVLGLFLIAGVGAPVAWLMTTSQPEPTSTQAITPRTASDKAKPESAISFNRDIRPILSDKCFACHGPDAAVAEGAGGFRLDVFEEATKPATSGDTPIVPGNADASAIISRITHSNPKLVMPPPNAHSAVTDDEVVLLKQWINAGAAYEGHWAYVTPTKPAPPKISAANEAWVKNNIDRFIAARLERVDLSPSPEADRTTLIRRLSLDLIGLPPTIKEIDAFVADDAPDAYEKLVDRLLASPHFGERLAVPWLDAARYADTIGYQLDHYRSAWPYRDYVIKAFNENKPYDEFVVEQLAGDLLPNTTDEQKLATAFCRQHMMNHEGGSIDEEFRVTAVADRIETIATVFMAQTYNCAMCHDHKYDPTTQQDYYNLFKYFHSIPERGVHSNRPERAIAYAPRMDWFTPSLKAELAEAEAALKRAKEAQDEATPNLEAKQADWESALRRKHGVRWAEAALTKTVSTRGNTTFENKPDESVLLSNRDSPGQEDLTLTYQTKATGLRLIKVDALTDPWLNDRVGRAENGDAQPTHIKITATSLTDPTQKQQIKLKWAWATMSEQGKDLDALNVLKPGKPGWGTGTAKDKHPRTLLLLADQTFGYEGGTELEVFIEHRSGLSRRTLGRIRVGFAEANESVVEALPVVTRDWYLAGPFVGNSFDGAFDKVFGPEISTAPLGPIVAAGKQKWQHKPEFTAGKNQNLIKRESAFYLGRMIHAPSDRTLRLKIGYMNGLRAYLNGEEIYTFAASGNELAEDKHAIELPLKLKTGENKLVLKIVNTQQEPTFFNWRFVAGSDDPKTLDPLALIPQTRRTKHGQASFSTQWQAERYGPNIDLIQAEKLVQAIRQKAIPVSVMEELTKPKDMFVLARGDYSKPIKDRPAKLDLPSFIDLPLPKGESNNRLGFAKWLVHPDHPLTARVHVNRLWQMVFGTGIVATVEDFGSQAEWPSHPRLLDHLAVTFVESGWDQKALLKSIVMSATYRQQARRNAKAEQIDADNRLLSYFPRKRLPGEFIRDHALAASGLLNETIGGPSVKPYQPAGLWREVSMGPRSNTNVFKRDDGDKLYRRSLYTFIKRKSPPPQLQTFGTPNREACVVNRGVTNTPLQTLVLWNDEQFLEAARALAQDAIEQNKDDDDRLAYMARRCTGDTADADQLSVLRDLLAYYRERYAANPDDAKALLKQGEHPLPKTHDPSELAAWMMVGNTLLSLDKTIVRD